MAPLGNKAVMTCCGRHASGAKAFLWAACLKRSNNAARPGADAHRAMLDNDLLQTDTPQPSGGAAWALASLEADALDVLEAVESAPRLRAQRPQLLAQSARSRLSRAKSFSALPCSALPCPRPTLPCPRPPSPAP